VGNDLLAESAFNIENWIMRKVSDGFRRTINNTLINGDGLGKPQGILHPSSGIPICETSPSTPPRIFLWQDLIGLKMEVPSQWQAGAVFLMNERTFGLLMSMSDSANRPLWNQLPGGQPGFQFAGAPINIVSQLPDVAPPVQRPFVTAIGSRLTRWSRERRQA
jgi:HK97 family phage major capsid protein